jgi:hypothetical protein
MLTLNVSGGTGGTATGGAGNSASGGSGAFLC